MLLQELLNALAGDVKLLSIAPNHDNSNRFSLLIDGMKVSLIYREDVEAIEISAPLQSNLAEDGFAVEDLLNEAIEEKQAVGVVVSLDAYHSLYLRSIVSLKNLTFQAFKRRLETLVNCLEHWCLKFQEKEVEKPSTFLMLDLA